MEPLLQRLPRGARVAVIRLRSLGDCVLTTPALEILKRTRPDLELAVVAEPRWEGVFENNPDVNQTLQPGLRALARWHPSLVLNLHGGTRSMALVAASRARFRAGFAHHRGAAAFYNVPIPRAQTILGEERKVHTAEHLASAIFYLGAPRCEIPRARLFASPRPAERPYAVLHPLASAPGKAWPAERFLAVARRLNEARGLEPVFIAGPGEDLDAFAAYRGLAGAPLAEVKSLLAGAALFIGNDSGPAHMAAAFGIPVIVFYGPSDPVVWAPWKTASRVFAAPEGMAGIDAGEVIAAMERLRVAA
ncbi:MAG: glycosyltransferase family 9 protein [Acidobacteria bacterium]|nr:glycosyltransferase family 9 protein [Acidobacteriota bacterium]